MRTWLSILVGFLAGVAVTAVLLAFSAQPRGNTVELRPAPTTSPILVDISGAVAHPGLYQLAPGSRLKDAVEAAGGLLPEADPDRLNLAFLLKDGEKMIVAAVGDPVLAEETGSALPAGNRSSTTDTRINLNKASLEELMSLPGIGETRAKQVIEYRETQGLFRSIEQIQRIPGIGPDTYEKLKDQISVE